MGLNPNAKKNGYSQLEEANENRPLLDQKQALPLPEELKQEVSNDSITQPLIINPKHLNTLIITPEANSYLAKLNQLPTWIFEGIKQVVDKMVYVATTMKSSFAQGLLKGFTDVLSQCSRIFFSKVYESKINEVKGALEYLNTVKSDINSPENSSQKDILQSAINHPRLAGLLHSDKNFNQFKNDHPELKINDTSSVSTAELNVPKSEDDRTSQTKGMS